MAIVGLKKSARAYAVIIAECLNGSACTCANGSITRTADAVVVGTTNTSYLFYVYEPGSYTITGSKDSSTASGSATITEEGQSVSITLTYPLYLYNRGTYGVPFTNGSFLGCTGGSATSSSDYFKITAKGTGKGISRYTASPVDLTNYTTLHAIGYRYGNTSNTAVMNIFYPADASNVYGLVWPPTSQGEFTIDVSSLTGSFYIGVGLAMTVSTASTSINMYSIWLTA